MDQKNVFLIRKKQRFYIRTRKEHSDYYFTWYGYEEFIVNKQNLHGTSIHSKPRRILFFSPKKVVNVLRNAFINKN
jgi:hypothetical protein